jgi:predicted nucleic acid-binding protein
MKKAYVLDACALIAYLAEEDGADVVQSILDLAEQGNCRVFMHAINLLEVYYGVRKEYGEIAAQEMWDSVKEEHILICFDTSENLIIEAGRLKSQYKISLADSIGLAQTVLLNASFITSDHHELDTVDVTENIDITWFR